MRLVAGRGAVIELLPGRGAVAELLVRATSGSSWPGRRGGATGTGSQRKPLGERRCCGIGKVQSSIGKRLSSIGKRLNGSNQHSTPFLFQCHKPHTAIPIIIIYKMSS